MSCWSAIQGTCAPVHRSPSPLPLPVLVPVPVPLAASPLPPMHQPYSLRAVACSGGVWCHGLVILVVVLGAGLHSSSPVSPSSEDAPTIHPTSSCSWTCGGCWFILPCGRWWGVVSMRRQVKEGWGVYVPYMGAIPSHRCLFPAPPLSIPPSFIPRGVGCLFSG